MNLQQPLRQRLDDLRKFDAGRPDLPGEHLVVLGVGLALMLVSGRSRSFLARALLGAAGGALVGRAASGTGGVARAASVLARSGLGRRRRFF